MKRFLGATDQFLQKYLPDPFVIAVGLTVFVFVCSVWYGASESTEYFAVAKRNIQFWGDGVWSLAAFTLHMAMILVGGYVIAISRPVNALLERLVAFVKTPLAAVIFCTLVSMLASWLNWGFGLVVGGIVALKVGKQVPEAPFRVHVASSYSGFLVWHAGLSGSVPLDMNSTGKVFASQGQELIPVSQTLYSTFNLTALGTMLLVLPLVNVVNLKIAGQTDGRAEQKLDSTSLDHPVKTPIDAIAAKWLERTPLVSLVICLMFGFYLFSLWVDETRCWKLDLDSVNLWLYGLGILLHGSPVSFLRAVNQATPKIAPILIQYPLYAAIMALLKQSGLAAEISNFFVSISNAQTFELMTFYSAGVLNLLVPSGGGQWGVQAPIVIPAAEKLGVDVAQASMAVAWGDAWTNMLQPFWAVPLLSIAGLGIKDILGFCINVLVASGLVLSLLFLVF